MSSLLLCAAAAGLTSSGTLLALSQHEAPGRAQRTLTLEERVSYQRAIEEVYWRHRIWPKENSNPKPSLDAVMSQAQLEKKVKDYLRNSQALEDYWQRTIAAEQLQAEMNRIAKNTKQPEVLQELDAQLRLPHQFVVSFVQQLRHSRVHVDLHRHASAGFSQEREQLVCGNACCDSGVAESCLPGQFFHALACDFRHVAKDRY
jgi:hypothetical protein